MKKVIIEVIMDELSPAELDALSTLLGIATTQANEVTKPKAKIEEQQSEQEQEQNSQEDDEAAKKAERNRRDRERREAAKAEKNTAAKKVAEKPTEKNKKQDLMGEGADITLDDVRNAMSEVIEDFTDEIREKMTEYGAANIRQLKEEYYADFYDFLEALAVND